MHYRERRHRSVEILGRQKMSQPDDKGIEISNVPSEAVASIPPNLKSKSGASSPHFWAHVPPLSG